MNGAPVRVAALAAMAVLVSAGTFALHDTWLMPESFFVSGGDTVGIHLAGGAAFPETGSPLRAGQVADAAVRLGGRTTPLTARAAGAGGPALHVVAAEPGTITAWVTLRPRESEPAHVVTEHAKTFVRVMGRRDSSWAQPTGQALEIVPEMDPSALRAGDTLRVRVLRAREPVAAAAVTLLIEGGESASATTDASGHAVLVLARQGRALLRVSHPRPGAEGPRGSDAATLTLVVGSPRC